MTVRRKRDPSHQRTTPTTKYRVTLVKINALNNATRNALCCRLSKMQSCPEWKSNWIHLCGNADSSRAYCLYFCIFGTKKNTRAISLNMCKSRESQTIYQLGCIKMLRSASQASSSFGFWSTKHFVSVNGPFFFLFCTRFRRTDNQPTQLITMVRCNRTTVTVEPFK